MDEKSKKSICEDCCKEFEQVYRQEYDAHTSFKYCKECRDKRAAE